MHRGFLALFTSFFLILQGSPGAQQTSSPSGSATQATSVITQSLKAQAGSVALADVTLTGTAERIAGSDDETGSATLQLMSNGNTKLGTTFASGTRTEIRSINGPLPSGTWIGPDGISHVMSPHNLVVDADWYVPALPLTRALSSPDAVVSYVGTETRDTQTVSHIILQKNVSGLSLDMTPIFVHLSQTEVFIDTTTSLPAAIKFNIHPEENLLENLPIEIRFSDYRNVNGTQIAFHIQKYLNNSLILDLQFSSAEINSGLASSSFTIQ